MTGDKAKFLIAAALFATWVGLVVGHVEGAEDLLSAIKYMLTGLAAHWLTASKDETPPFRADK